MHTHSPSFPVVPPPAPIAIPIALTRPSCPSLTSNADMNHEDYLQLVRLIVQWERDVRRAVDREEEDGVSGDGDSRDGDDVRRQADYFFEKYEVIDLSGPSQSPPAFNEQREAGRSPAGQGRRSFSQSPEPEVNNNTGPHSLPLTPTTPGARSRHSDLPPLTPILPLPPPLYRAPIVAVPVLRNARHEDSGRRADSEEQYLDMIRLSGSLPSSQPASDLPLGREAGGEVGAQADGSSSPWTGRETSTSSNTGRRVLPPSYGVPVRSRSRSLIPNLMPVVTPAPHLCPARAAPISSRRITVYDPVINVPVRTSPSPSKRSRP